MENPLLINLYRLPVRHINDYFVVVMMLKVLGLGLFFLCFFSKETSTKDVKGKFLFDFKKDIKVLLKVFIGEILTAKCPMTPSKVAWIETVNPST